MPTKEWTAQWERCREKLASPVDLNDYFTLPEIAGKKLAVLDIGPCDLPTGRVLVRDPLCYLEGPEQPYFETVPPGTFRTELCVVKPDGDGDCARYAAARVCFSDAPAVRFGEALVGEEDLDHLEEGEYFGFNVDAGLACICDKALQEAFCAFAEGWRREHPDGNLYDHYFADLFGENFRLHPEYQRSGGDWLNWTIPGTGYHLPIFQSGFGDGAYPVYWGYDAAGAVCQIVVQFIDLQLAYGKASDSLSLEDFDEEDGGLTGEVELPEWDGVFGSKGPYTLTFCGDEEGDGTATAAFSPEQKRGYDHLLDNQEEIAEAILGALLKEYPALQEQYGYEGEEKEELMPDAKGEKDLARLLTPQTVFFHPVAKEGLPYMGAQFSCTWDPEHAFGAMLHGDRVVKTGGADTAFLTWIAQRDLDGKEGPEAPAEAPPAAPAEGEKPVPPSAEESLLERLARWHEENEYQKIVDAIGAVPPEERTSELLSQLGRALNNLDRYDEALSVLELVPEADRDGLWHFRMGYAWYYKAVEGRKDKLLCYRRALDCFTQAARSDTDAKRWTTWCRNAIDELTQKKQNTKY